MRSARFKILNAFFIFAFIVAGISPACAFISGQSGFIEICASDGSWKKIKISNNKEAYALYEILNKNKTQNNQEPEHSKKNTDCGFCFANSNLTKTITTMQSVTVFTHSEFLPIGAGSAVFKSAAFYNFQSRGPPLFI